MKKLLFSIFLFTSSIYRGEAQEKPIVPGYMGLKFSVQYQLGINPQWMDLYNSYLPYFSNNFQIGYVVSRKHEIGIQYSRLDYSSNFQASYTDYNDGTSPEMTYSIRHRSFSGNNAMAYIKFFRERKGFIAPLGRYYLLGLTYQNTNDKYLVIKPDQSEDYTIVRSHDLAITMGVGRNIILYNRMLLTVEGDLNFPLSTLIRATTSSHYYTSFDAIQYNSPDGYFRHLNALDAMLANIIQIKIGIGALVF
jgi:hypothetical protein